MKVLYIGHFLENSGYSEAAKNYVMALHSAGVDVVCRNIKLNNSIGETNSLIKYLLSKELDNNVTHCIQHTLPHHWCFSDRFKNIGMHIYDTETCSYEWEKNLNLMDEIWTPTEKSRSSIKNDNIRYKTKIVPHACDITKFEKEYRQPSYLEIDGNYKFYVIAEHNKRKNLFDTIKAFHIAFKRNDPVSLVIKSSIPGINSSKSAELIAEHCNVIKSETRMYPRIENYIPEVIITERIQEEHLLGLHQYCDCYVSTSRGENWNQPLFDANCFGNEIIYYDSNQYTMYPYINEKSDGIHRIPLDSEPCFGYDAAFRFIGTSNDRWLKSDLNGLISSMRVAFNNGKNKKNRKNVSEQYSYNSVGELMKGLL